MNSLEWKILNRLDGTIAQRCKDNRKLTIKIVKVLTMIKKNNKLTKELDRQIEDNFAEALTSEVRWLRERARELLEERLQKTS